MQIWLWKLDHFNYVFEATFFSLIIFFPNDDKNLSITLSKLILITKNSK